MQIGLKGSPAHVLTNNNMTKDDKKACMKELCKESFKDTVKLTTLTAGAAGVGAVATKSNKFVGALKGIRHSVGEALSKVNINGTNLKEAVKNSSTYTKFNSLPTPAKAAIAVGAAALAIIAPLATIGSASKSGYIEGQHESK